MHVDKLIVYTDETCRVLTCTMCRLTRINKISNAYILRSIKIRALSKKFRYNHRCK